MRLERLTMVVAAIAAEAVCFGAACTKSRPAPTPPPAKATALTLAVLAVESDKFPNVAKAATERLAKVKLSGVDKIEVSKVSLEVVQLSIECVEPTIACYEAVGRSLSANRLLFAQVAPGKKRDVRVTVTLFDVSTRTPKTAEKIFHSERDATAGIDTLVAEATQ